MQQRVYRLKIKYCRLNTLPRGLIGLGMGVEYDPESKTFFGYVQGIEDEWGYFNLTELESIKGMFGLKVERDLHFKPVAYKEIIK